MEPDTGNNPTKPKFVLRYIAICIFLLACATGVHAAGDSTQHLDRKIRLNSQKGSVYNLLKTVSAQSGFLFIYDSRTVENDRKTAIVKGEYTLREAIRIITRKPNLWIDVSGNHILLRSPEEAGPTESNTEKDNKNQRIISGSLYDSESSEPVAYATVSLLNTSVGTVSNQRGAFRLVIPDSLEQSVIRFSHIGYESCETNAALFAGQTVDVPLEPNIFPLQEVEVRRVNPLREINEIRQRRNENYPTEPVYLTTFYREGIEHKKKPIDLSEAVLEIYKTDYRTDASGDHVKLIRKRRISNIQAGDTLLPKMKSGIRSCLILDIIKELPDFITLDNETLYNYAHTDISIIDDRLVNVISFKPKPHVKEPLFTGELFIENQRKAVEKVRFEVNPKYVDKATHSFVDRKAHHLQLTLQQAVYIVSYKPVRAGSSYYINHVRGDIVFKVRRKGHVFSTPLHFWFEMVTCKIDTVDVRPIPRNERLQANRIFADTKHRYDKDFWENFNIILPEERLKEAIINNLSEVIIQSKQKNE